MKSSKNKTEIDDIQPFMNVLKDAHATISTLNGKVWYYKHDARYYQNRFKKEKEKINAYRK